MHDHSHPSSLPRPRILTALAQYRLLGMALLGAGLVALIVIAAHWLTRPAPTEIAALPPGTFKPTAEQMAGLGTERAGLSNDAEPIRANGMIAIDEDRSIPVLMPYSGQVVRVLVEAGQAVARGQALLTIRTGDFVDARNGLFAAAAARATTASQLRIAEANAKRQEEIYKTAGGALRDYQQAQNDLTSARSAARSAEAALGAARDKLTILGKTPAEIDRLERVSEVEGIHAETTLHAPISGIIAQRSVSTGQYVSVGGDKPIMTIADPSHLWLVAQLPESDAAQVHLGDQVEVTTPAVPGRTFHATIDNVAAALDLATHRLAVRASLSVPDGLLKPQMFANFTILRPVTRDALTVPAGAVIHEGDAARLWIVRPDGLLQSRIVSVGDANNGHVRIMAGLTPGERIVTSGALFVNEAALGE